MAGRMKIGSRERALLVILGGIVLLGAVYLLFLRDDGGTTGDAFTPRRRITPRPTATPTVTPVPQATRAFERRDPFFPLKGGPTGAPTGGGTPSPGPTGGPRTGQRVVLLDIFDQGGVRFASVEVGGTVHNVKEGDTFAGNYRVVSIGEDCATFVLGDERFTLCIGQEVFK